MSFVNRDQLIEDFFHGFKTILTNASSYSKEHSYFIKSVENFKLKVDGILVVLNPLLIGVTSSNLVVGGKNLIKNGLYDELARLLHQRKIKSIEIRSQVTLEELIQFFSLISLPQKDIFKGGGINALIKGKEFIHFTIEELDYSVFLQGKGQECTDIWGYMLREAAHSNDSDKLNKLADDFGSFIKNTNEKDMLESEEIPADIDEFLVSLKEKNKEKFDKCSKEVFEWLLRNKKFLNEEKLDKLKPVFNSLDDKDFSNLLWEGLSKEDSFDALSLELFSKISEKKNPQKIADDFFNKINQSQQLISDPKVIKRIKDLLTVGQADQVSMVYRHTLESLIKGISSSGVLFFDQKLLRSNYRYIVLNILCVNDEEEDSLKFAAGALEKELTYIFKDNDFEFLKDLLRILVKKRAEGIKVCIDLEKIISAFIENFILNQSLPFGQDFLLEMVTSPAQNADYYLDRIFSSEKANKQVLTLFFRLYPANLGTFYKRLEQKIQNMDFLSALIDNLEQIDAPENLSVLEHIYSLANQLIKLKVLEAMRKLKKVDFVFLKLAINTDYFPLRKSLFSVLILDVQAKEEVLDLLFKISGSWGAKNNLLIENMQIVSDLKFTEASSRVLQLSRRKFFWNNQLRNKAKQILKEWNAC